jgi:two-component system sensor histidine kinase GlrK
MIREILLHPGSIRQLIFFSFVVAMIPLALLLWSSQNTLSKVGEIAVSEAQLAVEQVRSVEQIKAMADDNERLIGQYRILRKPEQQQLADNYMTLFADKLVELCERDALNDTCDELTTSLDKLYNTYIDASDEELNSYLLTINKTLKALSENSDQLIDKRIAQQQVYVKSMQDRQFWLVSIMVILTLIVIFFNTRLLAKPIERLDKLITAIATQEKSLPIQSSLNPKEFQSLDNKLRWLSDRLNQLEDLRHSMLRHASHELKTPLASIKEGCSLLTDEVVGGLTPKQREVLELLNNSVNRLNQLITQLLDYNRLLEQAKPDVKTIVAEPLLNKAVSENALLLEQNKQSIELQLQADKINVDPMLFRRILDNLLSNAVAHSRVNSIIIVKLYQAHNQLHLDVANQGQQIDPIHHNKLFEPFYRINHVRNDKVSGSGLGLSIVADCARLMHGHAQVVSEAGMDVCIRVSLPLESV